MYVEHSAWLNLSEAETHSFHREILEMAAQIKEIRLNEEKLCTGYIFRAKSAGVIRPPRGEVYEGEWILVASPFGIRSDLHPLVRSVYNLTLSEVEALETGVVKWYLVLLPVNGSRPRSVGKTSIHTDHLAKSKSFDMRQDAIEAFEHA